MSKTSKDKQKEAPTEAFFAQQLEEAGLGSLYWLGTTWAEAMADWNAEVVSFLSDRIKEDVKTQQALLHCKSPQDVQRVQLEFLEKAREQYTAETGKLLKIGLDKLPGAAGTKHMPV